MDKDRKREAIAETVKKDEENRRNTISQFDCTKNCFSCPFPGSKCVGDPEILKNIR